MLALGLANDPRSIAIVGARAGLRAATRDEQRDDEQSHAEMIARPRASFGAMRALVFVAAALGCNAGKTESASVAVARPADAKPAGTRSEVTFTSGTRTLTGFLWLPSGAGPHRAVVFNHGSDQDPSDQPALAQFYTSHGFVFFEPMRRGHGKSQGTYVGTLQASASDETRNQVTVDELTAQTDDVLAAFDYLSARPDVRKDAIALTGCSFGGIEVVLTAARANGYKAAVDFAGGAMAWSGNAVLRQRMTDAAAHATIPMLFIQAENDFNTEPSAVLSAEMDRVGKANRKIIFPPRGTTPREGHSLCLQADGWGNDVLAWFDHAMP